MLVAIVGCSGSGKSWLASQLRTRFGKESAVICLDDFYLDRAHLPMARRSQVNFDHPRAIDWQALERALVNCQAGLPVRLPSYDFARHVQRSESSLWHPKPMVIVEGLWLLRRPAVRRMFSWRIFIECSPSLSLERRITRDTLMRGRTAESVRVQFETTVAPMSCRYVLPQKRWADITVASPISEQTVDDLAAQLRELQVCDASQRRDSQEEHHD